MVRGGPGAVFTHATQHASSRKWPGNESRTICHLRPAITRWVWFEGVETVPRNPSTRRMGDRLRQARQARGMSLRRLADVLGVSPSLISQVETGRAKPSVNTLYAMANELDISLDVLLFMDTPTMAAARPVPSGSPFGHPDRRDPDEAIRSDPAPRPSSTRLLADDDQARIRRGLGAAHHRVHSECRLPPGDLRGGWGIESRGCVPASSGQEWGYVLSGTLRVTIGFDEFVLGPGDAITFDSGTPHRLANAGDEPARAVWYVLGRTAAEFAATGDGARPGTPPRG